ncbi:molecular chaperone HtpG [Rapidithrix thailandica]|uniref:Chaperone protein HtpG n=1 Tax=Rapidithrix thailandica TaxID=413964 RepID=A0AAW9RT49_9BACT
MQEKGTISVNTENIFPIIKKFLYSDHEIFLRELVSNAVDATQKVEKLAAMGEYSGDLGDTKVRVAIDKEAKTITISDRGIGMTAEEIKKYINQIAFSGATEFLEKYKDADTSQIIGKFGLGFYSAFMVANKVEIITQSYKEGTQAAHWECTGTTDFEIKQAEKTERGTDIILHVNEDSLEFLEDHRIEGILKKYCKFLPVQIVFGTREVSEKGEDDKEQKVQKDNIINNTEPLWVKTPNDLKEEDYLNFYRELYPLSEDPLFWIHLNVDYPFNLTGVLYFPKVKNDLTLHKDKIQLYSRQVFITDEVKDIVPEFLMLMHGVIDSPDIPLNVSRSYLQSDSNVKKINNYITKKVADKLHDLFKSDRQGFEEKWESIGLFVKYGMIAEEKFYDKAKNFSLLQSVNDDKYYTVEEYLTKIEPTQTDKDQTRVLLYTNEEGKQDTYIQSAKNKGYDVLRLDGPLDSHFIGTIESKFEKVSLKRVDADIVERLIDKGEKVESVLSKSEEEKIVEIFKKALNNDKLDLKVEALPADDMPVTITLPEFMRRMEEMAKSGGGMNMFGAMPVQENIAINGNHSMIGKILKSENEEEQQQLVKQAYDLALLSQNKLSGASLTSFIKRSIEMYS